MVLITGGAWQGKNAYAREHFDGEWQVVPGYHLRIREQLKEGKDPLVEAERFVRKQEREKTAVIMDEQGCGVVPTDAFEREYREACGRVGCYFAAKSQQVIRVLCGIGERIK